MTLRLPRVLALVVLCSFAAMDSARAQTEYNPANSHFDRWEYGASAVDSSAASTPNALLHGTIQLHTLWQGGNPTDEDWYIVPTQLRHSYVARVSSLASPTFDGVTGRLDRLTAASVLLTAAQYSSGNRVVSLRFEGTGSDEYVRAMGPAITLITYYHIELLDTTLFAPRFNNSSSQITVMLMQNTTATIANAKAHFYDAAGSLLLTHNFAVPANGGFTLNTSTLPALVGQSGSIAVSHDGDWAALKGKAVAVEPTTGFTFDTLFEAKPR